jgi:hypothetical protein
MFGLFSLDITLISVYVCVGHGLLVHEVFIMIFSFTCLFLELIQMCADKKKYIEDLWKWSDIIFTLLTISFIIARFLDIEYNLAMQWRATFIILPGYLRLVSYLRLFPVTRNLIEIIRAIVKDMLSFIVVLFLMLIRFSIIIMIFDRDASYDDQLNSTYQLLYSPPSESISDPSQVLIISLILFLLNVVLLNMLISIMGDSYDKV